jgi:hypothetical protein
MANKTMRGHRIRGGHRHVRCPQLARKVSWESEASWASCDTTDSEYSEQSGLLDKIALALCGCQTLTEHDGNNDRLSPRAGKNNSFNSEREVGYMLPYFPSYQDIRSTFRCDNYVSISDTCISVVESELTTPSTIAGVAHIRGELVTFESMNRPTTEWGWLPFTEKSTHCGDSRTIYRGSKATRQDVGNLAGTNAGRGQRPNSGLQMWQLHEGKDARQGTGSRAGTNTGLGQRPDSGLQIWQSHECKVDRKGTGSRASTKGQRPDCGVQIRQLRKGKDACHGIGSRWQDHR